MNFIDFEVGNTTYKLRLNTRSVVLLEKQLGCNPVMIFIENGKERVPTITEMVAVLHASLQQYQHGISMSDAYDIFDEYLASGKATTDFLPTIMELYRICGLVPKAEEVAVETKNV